MAQVSDLFARANEDPLSDGGKWFAATGFSAGKIVSNAMCAEPFVASVVVFRNDYTGSGGADQFCKIKFGTLTSAVGIAAWICGPTTAGGALNGYLAYYNVGASLLVLRKFTNGSSSDLKAESATFATGDTARVVLSGGTVYVYKNATLVTSQADSSFTGGSVGINYYQNGASATDATVTEFYGGDGTDYSSSSGGAIGRFNRPSMSGGMFDMNGRMSQ